MRKQPKNKAEGPKIPSRLSAVPAFPPIAARLLAILTQDEDSIKVSRVARLISADPIFSGSILQYANSAQFGLQQPVSSISQAVMILGLDRTRQIVAGVATSVYIRAALRVEELHRCWRHTMACAIVAEEIAPLIGWDPGEAYTGGILHDIGRLGLLVAFPKQYERVVREAAQQRLDILDFERERFGIDHTEAGRWLAQKWRLPEEFVVVAGRHHDRLEGQEFDLNALIHVACRLADHLGFDVAAPMKPVELEEILRELPEAAREAAANRVAGLAAKIEERISEFERDAALVQNKLPLPVKTEQDVEEILHEDPPEDPEPEVLASDTRLYITVAAICFLLFLVLVVQR